MAAPIDIKNTFIRITDGRRATLTPPSTPPNSEVTFTDASRHRGTRPAVRVALIVAGLNTAFSVVVGGPNLTDITINAATDGAGASTTTANAIVAGIIAVPAAAALVTTVAEGTGLGITDAFAQTSLANGPRTVTMKVGEGNLTYSEKKTRQYINDRGLLDLVRNADQEPFDLSFGLVWDYLQAVAASGTPTAEDALMRRGEAAVWESTSSDQCEPYAVDIELEHIPPCVGVPKEFMMFPTYRFESLDHDPKAGTLSTSGKCNALEALDFRIS